MKSIWISLLAVVMFIFAGCESADVSKGQISIDEKKDAGDRNFLTVDFQQGQKLRYRFTSSRDIETDWGPSRGKGKKGGRHTDKSFESIEMVVSYEPVEVNPYGLTTIKATCESVKVTRRGKGQRSGRDAVETLQGKTFTLTVGPTGKISNYSNLKQLILENICPGPLYLPLVDNRIPLKSRYLPTASSSYNLAHLWLIRSGGRGPLEFRGQIFQIGY